MGQITRELFEVTFRTLPGNVPFKGQIAKPETDLGTQRFVPGRRYLVTRYANRMEAGTVFKTSQGKVWLVGDGEDNEAQRLNYAISHCFPMTDALSVKRPTVSKHPITDVIMETANPTIATNVWMGLESMLEARDAMAVPAKQYRVVSGYPLEENDLLSNGLIVRNMQHFLGVYVGDAR